MAWANGRMVSSLKPYSWLAVGPVIHSMTVVTNHATF